MINPLVEAFFLLGTYSRKTIVKSKNAKIIAFSDFQ
jgi:hypothetical protein